MTTTAEVAEVEGHGTPGDCSRGCDDHGWIILYYDREFRVLGIDINDPALHRTEDRFRPANRDDLAAGVADEIGEPVFDGTHRVPLWHTTAAQPCPVHRPSRYVLWIEGCLRPGHLPCERCRTNHALHGRRAAS
jgi:hypothetical protein